MAIQQISPGQIRSVSGKDSMGTDILQLIDKTRSYAKPVATANDLPITNNIDGDTRLVLNDNKFYIWDEPTQSWIKDFDKSTEARTKRLRVDYAGMTIFNTDLKVGTPGGLISLETVAVIVNGMIQTVEEDYVLGISAQQPYTLTLQWVSTDFALDITDVVKVNYDMLVVE